MVINQLKVLIKTAHAVKEKTNAVLILSNQDKDKEAVLCAWEPIESRRLLFAVMSCNYLWHRDEGQDREQDRKFAKT